MKKFVTLALVLVLSMTVSFVAYGDEFEGLEPATIIMADGAAKGAVGNLWAELFAQKLSEITNYKLTVNYYGNSALGSDTDIITQMQAGTVDACDMQSMNVVSFIPQLGVFELPLVFAKYNTATIDKVVKPGSKFFDRLNESFRSRGFELIDYLQGGTYREMSSNVPAITLADFQGIKIRTLTSEYQVSFWKNLGCIPTPLAFTELYTALQQGVVEAEENAIDTQVNSQFYEVQRYLILTHHVLYGNLLYMTSAKYNSLAPAYQKAIRDAALAASAELQPRLKDINDNAQKVMVANRVEVIELPNEVVDDMIRATEETNQLIRRNIGDEICDLLITSLAEADRGY